MQSPPASALGLLRNALIVGCVLLFHGTVLWLLQNNLRHTAEVTVPVELLSAFIEAPKPKESMPPAPSSPPPPKPKRPVTQSPAPPRPQAIPEPTPASPAPSVATTSAAPAAGPETSAPSAAMPTPAAAASVQLPTSDADYLHNPKPVYPAMSRRLGEQGKTIVRVWIDVDGLPKQASIHQSSGSERLDESARQAVLRWRYVPGKRNGIVEAMAFNVPINWVLN